MHDIRVASWIELNECLFQNTWNEGIRRFRSNYAYRGMTDCAEDLRTTLIRLGGAYPQLEHHLLRNFKKYAHRNTVPQDSIWNWLAVAQHHGLPTRMLDWTYSPYVALHFSTDRLDHFDRDGIIWCVDYVEAHQLLPETLRLILHEERSNTFTAEMLQRGARSLQELQALSPADFVLFLEPPSLDDRIVNQYALFSMMSSACTRLDEWLADHPKLVFRIVIPSSLKWEIRDKLDQANITERVLFPGLDGLSRWLRRHYSPR